MPEKSIKKKTRSRSPEKKAAQFEQILEAGKELFLKKGRDGFSLRGLAKVLGMNQNNLYNYVESKRELYIAIRNKFFKQFREENIKIIKDHKGSSFKLLMKIFNHFLEFGESDFGAFAMMHLRTAPPSDKIGPIEREYREFRYLRGTTRLLREAANEGDIKHSDIEMLTFLTYSLVLGAAIVERNMRAIYEDLNSQVDFIGEIREFGEVDFSSSEFRNFILENLKNFLKREKK